MNGSRFLYPLIVIICFILGCTTAGNKKENSTFTLTGISREAEHAYKYGDFRKVMELANQSILGNMDEVVLFYYASLVCFAEEEEERGMRWFFLALDNTYKTIEKNNRVISYIIPAYREFELNNSRGVLTGLWFLYTAEENEIEAEKIFPGTGIDLVDQALVVREFDITNSLYRATLLFCARHKDHRRVYQLIDFLTFKITANSSSFNVLKDILIWPVIVTLDKGEYIKEILDKKEILLAGIRKINDGIKASGEYKPLAIKIFREAIDIFTKLDGGKAVWEAKAFNEISVIYQHIGDYDSSLDCVTAMLDITRNFIPEGKHPWYTGTLNILGQLYNTLGDEKKAESLYLQALETEKDRPPEGNHPGFAALLHNLGVLYQQTGDYSKSESLYLQACEIQKNHFPAGKNPDYVTSLDSLAGLYFSMNDFNKAEALYLQALKIRKILRPAGKHPDYASTLRHLGVLYLNMGDYSKSKSFLLKALDITKDLYPPGKHRYYTHNVNDLAKVYLSIGDCKRAEPLFLQAFEIAKTYPPAGKHPLYTQVLNNLGEFYKFMGNYPESESFFLQALEIEKDHHIEKGDPFYFTLLINLAGLYKFMGDYSKAESIYIQAIKTLKTIPHQSKKQLHATIMNNIALFFHDTGKYSIAESLYFQALEIVKSLAPENKHPYYATTLGNLGALYKSTGQYKKAETLYLQALEIKEKLAPEGKNLEYGDVLNNLGILYEAMGDFDKAGPLLIQSLSLYQEFLQLNFMVLSEKEKESFINTLFPLFERFNSFVEKRLPENPGLAGTVANFHLFQKAILFRSAKKIRESIQKYGNEELNNNFNSWLKLRRRINKACELTEWERLNLAMDLKVLEAEANKLEKKISARSEDFRLTFEQPEYTWEDIRAVLKPGEAAVELVRYRVYDMQWTDTIHYAAIIIKPDSIQPENIFLENGNILEEEIITLYRNFMFETHNNLIACLDKDTYNILYLHLWQQIADKLAGEKTIFFSPDGIYHYINPSTLQDTSGRWLSEKWEIVRITSLHDLLKINPHRHVPVNPPVLVGFPEYNLDGNAREQLINNRFHDLLEPDYEPITYRGIDCFPPLPGSREEVETIADFYREKGYIPQVWIGKDALEEYIKTVNNPGVLHLATHAFFQEDITPGEDLRFMGVETRLMVEAPLLRSGLLFTGAVCTLKGESSPAGLENGILTAQEAMDLNLDRTELVVLSACDTGLGEIKNGEGIYGLQRAFLIAGADAIIMSLWHIKDQAAQDFMIEFYRKWLSGYSKREAYYRAVEWMKLNYQAPFYWGVFIMVGK